MNLRKIIKEEVNDFEWAEKVTPMDSLSDEERLNNYRTLKALQNKGFSKEEALKIMAEYVPPRERFKHEYDEDTVYWTTDHSSSTFQFNYPPKENSLTKLFVDWVKLNPGGTKREFYSEILGYKHRPGHNQQFWSSIIASGILRAERGPNGVYNYYIGPNFDKWTQGKLKRYMGINIPDRYRERRR
jgi:hypothetical protein